MFLIKFMWQRERPRNFSHVGYCHSLFLPLRQKQSKVLNSLGLEQSVNLSLRKIIIYFTVVPQMCQLLHKNTGKQAFPLRAGMMWPLFKAVRRVWALGSHAFKTCTHWELSHSAVISCLHYRIKSWHVPSFIQQSFFHGKEVGVWVWRLAARIRWQIPLVCYNALWSQRKVFAGFRGTKLNSKG